MRINADRKCPICGSGEKTELFRQRFDESGIVLITGYSVVVCRHCGFGYADQIPSQEEFDKYYIELSKYENATSGGKESCHDMRRLSEIASVAKRYIVGSESKILEIGCSTGYLLASLKKAGFCNLVGIDPSPSCAETARRLHGVEVFPQVLSNISLATSDFDFVIAVGVLEHVRDLSGAVRAIHGLTRVSGRVFIAVPDGSRYAAGEDAPFQEFSIEHINYFSPQSLCNLMQRCGFLRVDSLQQIVAVNINTKTPVIFAVFEKLEDGGELPLLPDAETREGLLQYIKKCQHQEERVRAKIERLINDRKPIMVWGVGTHTLHLLSTGNLSHARIVAFVDSNPRYHGQKVKSVPVLSPEEIQGRSETILVSSRAHQNDIIRHIRDTLHLSNEVVTLYDEIEDEVV